MGEGDRFRQTVRFILNGERTEIPAADSNRTLLRFLREDAGLTGTKEGCAEGDCGACTVVVADIDASGERLRARAINACIAFLPTLDGKAVFTVEGLAGETLHPVQQAMVEHHGSQCGFCTPGFVMSLFALYKSDASPGTAEISDALAGNLCRCTGYRPIVSAAQSMYEAPERTGDWRRCVAGAEPGADEAARVAELSSLASGPPLGIEHAGASFYAPESVALLADLVLEFPDATLLAGGTDVGLSVTKGLERIGRMIYTGKVGELGRIALEDGCLVIGAAVTLTDAMRALVPACPALEELFLRFASPPIRNAGTLGGNIANGSPIGDSMPALMVLDTELVVRRGPERRTIRLDEFYRGYRSSALDDGEFLECIRVPLPGDDEFVASYKVSKRFDQDISAVCTAYRLRLSDGAVEDIRIACGGMADVPKRARNAESSLIGAPWRPESLTRAYDALDADFRPISDMRATEGYRRDVCRNLLLRFFSETAGDPAASVYRYAR